MRQIELEWEEKIRQIKTRRDESEIRWKIITIKMTLKKVRWWKKKAANWDHHKLWRERTKFDETNWKEKRQWNETARRREDVY